MFIQARQIFVLAPVLTLVSLISLPSIVSGSSETVEGGVNISMLFDDLGDPPRWKDWVIDQAFNELRERHPNLDISLDFKPVPYQNLSSQFLEFSANESNIDIIDIDPTWLGEFVEKGLLTDLTNLSQNWEGSDDLYQEFFDAGVYGGKLYGVYIISDIRALWYWKDMLKEAGVDPESLKTWDGYVAAAKQLNLKLRPEGIEGAHLVGASHSPDIEFYPYLWMLGGDILQEREGHPTKGTYWFPAFNGSEGVRALQFIKDQIQAGIKPQTEHHWGKEFLDRKFAIMLEALQHHIPFLPVDQQQNFENEIGMIPMFPVPNPNSSSASLLGGWELGIPADSKNKDLAWEMITIMSESEIISPLLQKYGYLPTRISIGENPNPTSTNMRLPYYDQVVSMIEIGRTRPNIPEYSQIASYIKEALDAVYYDTKDPIEALDDAATKSAKALGW
jgi:multiple sugar transport system substrate-binding protein